MRCILSKKGSFREDVPYLIISIIGLVFIIYAGAKLYNLHRDQEERVAKERLDLLIEKIDGMEKGISDIQIQGVGSMSEGKSWHLVGWNRNDGEAEGKPDKCFGNSCICLCKPDNFVNGDLKSLRNVCQKNGFCEKLDYDEIETISFIHIENKVTYLDVIENFVFKDIELGNRLQIYHYIRLPDNLIKFEIFKGEKKLAIVYDSPRESGGAESGST